MIYLYCSLNLTLFLLLLPLGVEEAKVVVVVAKGTKMMFCLALHPVSLEDWLGKF